MNLILTALLAVPGAPVTSPPKPAGPFDGPWTIVALERNDKNLASDVHVNIADGRLSFSQGQGEPALTLELAANHVAWLWAGPSKMVWVPEQEVYSWIGNIPNRDPRFLVRDVTPGHWKTVAQRGFYLERNGLLYVFFGLLGDGPSLTLTLRRETGSPSGNPPQR
jgi:hypothetical protein